MSKDKTEPFFYYAEHIVSNDCGIVFKQGSQKT